MKPRANSRGGSSSQSGARSGSQSGYALLMMVFLVATLLLAASMAVPSVLVEGRRQMEQEVIWRGNQYVRAIRLYYQKNGRFPQTMDDLTKASNNGTYFLRKAYTDISDPDNQGEWRMIYASPTGQLTGSVRYTSLQQMALMMSMPTMQNNALAGLAAAAGAPGAAGQQAALGAIAAAANGAPGADQALIQALGQAANQLSNGASNAAPGQQPGQQTDQLGFGPSGFSSQSAQSGQSPFQLSQPGQTGLPGQQGQNSAQASPFAPTPISSGPVFGGYLVGVGCKLKRPSQIVYHGGKTYDQWEFIWNPLTVTAIGGRQSGALPGQAAPNPNGAPNPNAPNAPGFPGAPASPSPAGPSGLGTGSPTAPGF